MNDPKKSNILPEKARRRLDRDFYQAAQYVSDDIKRTDSNEYMKWGWDNTHRSLKPVIKNLIAGYDPEDTPEAVTKTRKAMMREGLIIGTMIAKCGMNTMSYDAFGKQDAATLGSELAHEDTDLTRVIITYGFPAAQRLFGHKNGLIIPENLLTNIPSTEDYTDLRVGSVGYMANRVFSAMTSNAMRELAGKDVGSRQDILADAQHLSDETLELTLADLFSDLE